MSSAQPPGEPAPKAGCGCGCISLKSLWTPKVKATPEFKRQLEEGIASLLEKAKQVKTRGRAT
jgi:hypothetical protein